MALLDRLRRWGPGPAKPQSRDDWLDFLEDYVGAERLAEIKTDLAAEATGGFRVPGKTLCILFPSRAGSNLLGRLLSNTPHFTEIGESFAPVQLKLIRDRHGLADTHEAAQWMIDNRGTETAFGFKAGFTVLIAAVQLGLMDEISDQTQFVLLRRRDRVAQAISLVKGALSGQMHSNQPRGRVVSTEEYDGQQIADAIAHIERNEGYFADIVERLGKEAPVYYYEDICAEPRRHVVKICGRMDIAMPDGFSDEIDLKVMRDAVSLAWHKRFCAENPELAAAAIS